MAGIIDDNPVPTCSLTNICKGAVEELFQRELKDLLENIRDPNTNSEKKRSIILTLDFDPLADRSGAEVSFKCTSKLAGADTVKGSIFFATRAGEMKAFTRDPKQIAMFRDEPVSSPKQ